MNTARLGFGSSFARALRVSTAFAFPLVTALAACGGTADSMTPVCSAATTPQAAGKFCAPTNVTAGQPLKLQIQEQCGGCSQQATKCEVVVSGTEIKLQVLGNQCVLPPLYACPAVCAVNTFDCAVPALAAGTYRVTTPAGSTTVSMMTADTTATTTSCIVTTP